MGYDNKQQGGFKKKFNNQSKFKKRPKKEMQGLCVEVYNNNIEGALKIFKRKVKDSKLMLTLKEKSFFEKPSAKRRAKRALAKSRYKVRPEERQIVSKKIKK